MKSFLLLAIAASAYALPAPVIKLDTTNLVESNFNNELNVDTLKKHRQIYAKKHADYVFECAYTMDKTDEDGCLAPTAVAYDHHETRVPVTKSYYRIDRNANEMEGPLNAIPKPEVSRQVEFVTVTQIIKYDAMDTSGNAAEQLVCAFFIYDSVKPDIIPCGDDNHAGDAKQNEKEETIEAIHSTYKDDFMEYDQIPSPYHGCRIGQTVSVVDDVDDKVQESLTSEYFLSGQARVNAGINLQVVGKWEIKYEAQDFSGNRNTGKKTVFIEDTLDPVITRIGPEEIQHECNDSNEYVDQGATCTDLHDGPNLAVTSNIVGLIQNPSEAATTYIVKYTCTDSVQRQDLTELSNRKVTVKDTKKPTVGFKDGDQQHIQLHAGAVSWTAFGADIDKYPAGGEHQSASIYSETNDNGQGPHDPGFNCADQCDDKPKKESEIVPTWEPNTPGTYVQTYTCTDAQGNAETLKRTLTVVDKHRPIMKLHGKDPHVIEASPGYKYEDEGASCVDEIDGEISDRVKVMGAVVNGAVAGTYIIEYHCKDSAGNEAAVLDREVIVGDGTKPTIFLKQAERLYIEASFPYDEPGATAFDSLDGDLSDSIVIAGGEFINTKLQKYQGETIPGSPRYENNQYIWTVTYNVRDLNNNPADEVKREVIVKDTLPPVIEVEKWEHDEQGNLVPWAGKIGSYNEIYDKLPYERYTYEAKTRNSDGYLIPESLNAELAEESVSTGINGWIIGAVASAVTGLALLGYAGYSMKKTTYASVQSVPV